MSDASPVFEARDPDSFSWSGRPGRDERVAGALVGLALLLTFRERVDGSLPTGEDRTPWPAGTILWTSRSSILPTVLVAGCFAWFARRPTAWAGLLLALVFALTLLLRATARVRVETDGLDVWRATSIRPLRVAWDQIAGLEGGEATPLTIRRHRVGPVRSRVRLLPGHFTRLQATLQLHGTEAVFA